MTTEVLLTILIVVILLGEILITVFGFIHFRKQEQNEEKFRIYRKLLKQRLYQEIDIYLDKKGVIIVDNKQK